MLMLQNRNKDPFYGVLIRQIIQKTLPEKVLKAIQDSSEELGCPVYVVGGYVRDIFLGRPSSDIDLVTQGPGSGIALAKKIHAKLGKQANIAVFKSFGTAAISIKGFEIEIVGARKESYRANSRNPIVEDGSFYDDQLRRDFTINALSISLNKESFGNLVDPFDGLSDLRKRIIRTPLDPDETFSDDPLRMMRAIRFASQLQFEIPKDILSSIKVNASRIQIVAIERITEEFLKIMASERPSVGLSLMEETGIMQYVFPEILELKRVETIDGRGHKDNFEHTLQVVDRIAPKTDNIYLRLAALFHDIAKPVTKRYEKGKGWTFHNHNFIGARMIPKIFKRVKLPLNDKMKYVQKLVDLHMRPATLAEEGISDSAIRRLLFDAGDDIEDLMTLCEADITSKNQQKVTECMENFSFVRQRLKEIEEKDRIRNFQPPLTGKDIMDIFGLEPGAKIGELKSAVKDAILDGRISNDRASAEKYLHECAKLLGIES